MVSVEEPALFDSLRSVIRESLEDESVGEHLLQQVDAMQAAVGTKTFAERYKEFVSVAADHMALIAPFLPALTQLLL